MVSSYIKNFYTLHRWVKYVAWAAFLMGTILMLINIYGLFQPLRNPILGSEDPALLRFEPEEVWTYERSMKEVEKLNALTPKTGLVSSANKVVQQSLVHVEWKKVDPGEYRQLIPVWENYYLYTLGLFSGLPQIERYHFSNYKKTFERGIGICGDASIALSSILDDHNIENRIISFPGHVIVEYLDAEGDSRLIDPDFGVELGASLAELTTDTDGIHQRYLDAGYSTREVSYLLENYQKNYAIFENTYDFMAKRYIFERASYILKWLFPLILLLPIGLMWWSHFSSRHSKTK
jgi:hypothetical protein